MSVFYLVTDPLLGALAGVPLGFALRRLGLRWIGAAFVVGAVGGLFLLATPFVSARLLAGLESGFEVVPRSPEPPPQAVVVLSANLQRGAPEFDGDTVGELTLERMRYGAVLQRRTGLPLLVTGGSIGRSKDSIGGLMAKVYTEEYGIAPKWVESASWNTYQNAALSRRILEPEGVDSVYLVTHAWHMRRAVASFEDVGFEVVPAPTGFTYVGPGLSLRDLVPRSTALAASSFALHEWIGMIWYRLRYIGRPASS